MEILRAVVIAGIDKTILRKVVIKTCAERRKVTLLKGVKIRKKFEENVIELVDVGAPILWRHFKDGVLEACDEVCGKKMGMRNNGDSWWWNEEVKEAVSKKKETHKAMCQSSSEENKRRNESMKNKAKKTVSKALRESRLKRRLLNKKIAQMGCLSL